MKISRQLSEIRRKQRTVIAVLAAGAVILSFACLMIGSSGMTVNTA